MDEVTAKLGQPGIMKCQIIGRPLPDIKWYHASKEIIESRKYEMSSDGRNHSLSIMTDQQEDEGEYTCKAVNDAGEAETKGVLVLEAPASFHPDYPLKETYYAGLGSTLRIHVVYIGRPEPKIMWLHGAKTLENTEDTSIETTEHYTHLVIKNVQRRVHGGKYRIRLHNHFGRADTAFNVEIYGMFMCSYCSECIKAWISKSIRFIMYIYTVSRQTRDPSGSHCAGCSPEELRHNQLEGSQG